MRSIRTYVRTTDRARSLRELTNPSRPGPSRPAGPGGAGVRSGRSVGQVIRTYTDSTDEILGRFDQQKIMQSYNREGKVVARMMWRLDLLEGHACFRRCPNEQTGPLRPSFYI